MQLAIQSRTPRGRLLALATSACVISGIATAQQAELASPVLTGPGRAGPAAVPASAPAASTKAVLYDNGPYITQTSFGCGGGDVSEVENGLTTLGYGHQQQQGLRVADDFLVTGNDWTIERLKWKAYQTGAPTTGTITGITINLYDSSPFLGGTSIAGDDTTDRLQSTAWTGVYRVTSTTQQDCNRAIIEVTGDMSFSGTLPPEDYWLSVACDGSLVSGPWANPTVPWDNLDNGEQSVAGLWGPLTGGQGNGGVDFPFVLEGTTSTCPTIYCTSKPSSIPGCVPTIGAAGCSASITGGPGSFDLTCGPVPGGGMPSIVIHTPNGARNPPIQTSFGYLCINSPFWRASPPTTPGGVPLMCNGNYVFDFGAYMQQHAPGGGLLPGNTCDAQFWYRDPPSPGSANFSNAVSFFLAP